MDGQPMLQSTATSTNNVTEEVSVGCVMHRYKGYKAKRRWGQLRIESKNKTARCVIRLYKHDVLNIHQEINKSKEPKLKYEIEFSIEDFCGLEKGEHFDKHGQRRYLCIITKDKHLIIEDAVVTATGINHNVLGTWHQLLTEFMKYANRWKLVENNPKLAIKICYLHVGIENIAECHSLEDKTRENRNCLVLRMWKTRTVTDIKEREVTINGGKVLTDLTFNVADSSGIVDTVNMTVEGKLNLRQLINQLKRLNGDLNGNKATRTVCPAFDDLNFHPNLVPKQKPGKGLKKFLPRTLSSNNSKDEATEGQSVTKSKVPSQGNIYVKRDMEEKKDMPPSYYNVVALPPEQKGSPKTSNHTDSLDRRAPSFHDANSRIKVPPSLLDQSVNRKDVGHFMPLDRHNSSPGDRNPSVSPPRLPSPGFGDEDSKKAPGLATQTSYDSDYQTGDPSLLLTDTSFSQNPYVNTLRLNGGEPEFLLSEPPTRSRSLVENGVYENLPSNQPPAIPARDEEVNHLNQRSPYMNLGSAISAPNLPVLGPRAPPLPPKDSHLPSTSAAISYSSKMKEPNENHAPPVPERSPSTEDETSRSSRGDLIVMSMREGTLPPLPGPEEQNRTYENRTGTGNSVEFEFSINEILQGTISDSNGRWLDLPYAVFVKVALGLEKEGITVGDWKALAERLGLTFHDIQQLSSLMRVHTSLRPLQVLLLHWSRTQSPCLYTRDNLKDLLESIGRDDLAIMIPNDS